MRRKLGFLLGFFMVGVLFVACGSSNKPIGTIEKLYESAMNEDTNGIIECFHVNVVADERKNKQINDKLKGFIPLMIAEIRTETDKHGGLKNIELITEKYQDDDSKVFISYKANYKDGTSSKEGTANLIKIDGKWKISF